MAVASEPVRIPCSIRFGEDFEFDIHAYRLRRSGRILKLERIPTEILAVLVEQQGQLVSREQIVERIWGKGAFLDTDNSINGAIRKVRQVLKDDPEQPRFIQTVTGKGYRFIAPVTNADLPRSVAVPNLRPVVVSSRTAKPAVPRWPVLLGIAIVLIAVLGLYLRRSHSQVRALSPSGRRDARGSSLRKPYRGHRARTTSAMA